MKLHGTRSWMAMTLLCSDLHTPFSVSTTIQPTSMTNQESYGTVYQGEALIDAVNSSIHHPEDDDSVQEYLERRFCSFRKALLVFGGVFLVLVVGSYGMNKSSADENAEEAVALLGESKSHAEKNEPNQHGPLFFEQPLDHHDPSENRTWFNTYFTSDSYFEGPGHPIFTIIGGEGEVEGILYPYVSKRLAKEFGGYVLQTEHRFYGASQPVGPHPSPADMDRYLAPEQALMDYVNLIRSTQAELGCSPNRSSPEYCPVVTIGGSYPGFLSAMMRFVHPDVVDIGYASSAPLILYEHPAGFDTNEYYDKVTQVAEKAYPGCTHAVRSSLKELHEWLDGMHAPTLKQAMKKLGICEDTFPEYIANTQLLATELTQVVVTSSADSNMGYYPPSKETDQYKICEAFARKHENGVERYANFLKFKKEAAEDENEDQKEKKDCFDLQTEVPAGETGTISSCDWSGTGDGEVGRTWEFQQCRDLVVQCGFGPNSMFYPPREWSLDWVLHQSQRRFHVDPQPHRLVNLWHFDKLLENGASYILFTNGLNDGWSASSYTEDLSGTVIALNFPNGAHHSDLGHEYPTPGETKDIVKGHEQIVEILRGWLSEI